MSKNDLKIVFFGTPDFAMLVLDALIQNGYNVSHFQLKSLKDEQVFEEFKSLEPDLCIVAAYGKILPSRYLEVPKYGFLNVHPSLLPKYRGPSPIQTAILNGNQESGVTIMVVDKEVDHGPILDSAKYQISSTKYNLEVSQELFELGADLLIKIIPKYINGEIKAIEQNHDQATFTKMFGRTDGRIDWSKPTEQISNQIRALNPEPGTWTTWKDKVINISNITTFKVVSPQVINMTDLVPEAPGIVSAMGNDIVIKTETGYLILKSIQLEGGKVMDAKSFLNGHPDFIDSQLE